MTDHLRELEAALRSPDVAKRLAAAQRAAELGPDAGPLAVALVRGCGDADEEVRNWTTAALEELGPPPRDAARPLVDLLDDPCAEVNYWAATLLGRLEADAAEAVPALTAALRQNAHRTVRQRAAWALGRIGPAARPAKAALVQAASDADPRLARLAQQALDQITESE